jgi:predicted outer membrane protein
MVNDHAHLQRIKSVHSEWQVKVLGELKVGSGKDFERAYCEMQVHARENAVALFEGSVNSGDNSALESCAPKTLAVLKGASCNGEKALLSEP